MSAIATSPPSAACRRHGVFYCHACTVNNRPMKRPVQTAAGATIYTPGGEPARWQTVLRAAAELGATFGRTALVLAAWRADPAAFGLEGAEAHHPDANAVFTYVYGENGLVRRGYFKPAGRGVWALTEKGRAEAARMAGA